MIELLALERIDGLLFFREAGRIFALRAPYEEPLGVSEAAVARAVGDHGFEALHLTFGSLEEMLVFVRAEQQKAIADLAPGSPDIAAGLLRIAPAATITRFLDRVEHELFPRRAYVEAARLLEGMLTHSLQVARTPALLSRATVLLDKARLAPDAGVE
jgi:hypothetical protein